MSREIINVGSVPNDGSGDPIRTAYIKCNNNFGELYSRAQSSPPPTLVGSAGDTEGMYAYDENNFYYCFANYDGSTTIWGELADTNAPSQIVNGNSNVSVAANSSIRMGSGGVANIAVFSATNASLAGNLLVAGSIVSVANLSTAGNVNGAYIFGNGSQLTGLPATYGNSNVATYLPTYTGNIGSGNITTSGILTVTGNITGGNIATAGRVTVTGNVTGGNIVTGGKVTASGNVSGDYIIGDCSLLTNITAVSNVAVTEIANSTSKVSINGAGGSILMQVGGVANIAVITASGEYLGGLLEATGNITGANINTGGKVVAAGNVSGTYIIGDGSLLTGITARQISNGTSNVNIVGSAGNVTIGVAGTSNVAVFASTGEYVSGLLNVTGNVLGGNINSNAAVTGVAGVFTGNVSAGNVTTTGRVTATGNVTGGNLSGTNITGTLTTASQTNITSVGTLGSLSVTGNVTSGNLEATALTINTITSDDSSYVVINDGLQVTGIIETFGISATGNISGSYFLGNGSQLSGIDATSIQNGTANVRTFNNGNVTISAAGTANVVVVTSTGANITGTLNTGTGNANVGNIGTTNVVAANLTGTLQTAAQTNITSVGTLSSLSVTGNVSSGNLITAGLVSTSSITKTGSNAVGNIGSNSSYFNTVFAQATSALYADVAEYYEADADYPAGTVVKFGNQTEITIADIDHDSLVVGVISKNPAFVMNSGLNKPHAIPVALLGRTPCLVRGVVKRGQMMVSAGGGYARAEKNPAMGTVIGKALENFDGVEGTIEILVGRM